MKEKLSWRILLIVGISAALLLTAAAPFPSRAFGATLQATSDLVRVTVDNRTEGTIRIILLGDDAVCRMIVGPEAVGMYTVQRGTYEKWVTACGVTVKDEDFEITRHTRMIMPICGANANQAARGSAVDLSDQIKIVPISIENDSSTDMLVIMTGPATYVLQVREDAENDYTVVRGTYDVQYYACGRVGSRSFAADKDKVLELRCPR
jgi:hypothetical protein